MTYTVVVRRSAERDLIEAESWYEIRRPGLGQDFRNTVDRLLRLLAEQPTRYRVFHRNVRCALLVRFPYLIYFRIDGARVRVLACLLSTGRRAACRAEAGRLQDARQD